MKCPNCKTENPLDERFCWRCHVPLGEEFRPQWGRFSKMVRPSLRPLLVLLGLAAAGGIFFAVYALVNRGSPAAAATAFLRAAEADRLDMMYPWISEASKRVMGRKELAGLIRVQAPAYGRARFSVLDAKVRGDRAVVAVGAEVEVPQTPSHPGAVMPASPFDLPMVKEEDGWRVDALKMTRAGPAPPSP
jgi:hypothetical protein